MSPFVTLVSYTLERMGSGSRQLTVPDDEAEEKFPKTGLSLQTEQTCRSTISDQGDFNG